MSRFALWACLGLAAVAIAGCGGGPDPAVPETSAAKSRCRPAGSACNDGNPCTWGDTCNATGRECIGVPYSCDDGNPCTADACDGAGGCTHTPFSGACNDGDPCTTADTCSGGICTGARYSCDDGDPCTIDTCSGGICTSARYSCDDGNVCTDDACNGDGTCAHTNNTASCEDGNPCTVGDTCGGGVCNPGTAQGCNDGVTGGAPTNLTATAASHDQIWLAWQDNSTNEDAWEVHRSTSGPTGTFTLFTVYPWPNTTAGGNGGLQGGTEYCYRVRASRTGGGTTAYSDFSNTACATTFAAEPPGFRVTTVTTGVDLDANGYQATVWADWGWSWLYIGSIDLPVNGTVTVPNLSPGSDYVVEFSGAAPNCDLTSRNPQTVYLGMTWEPGVTVEFDVNCGPLTQLAFASTAGGNADIYVVNSNGTARTRLTTDPASDVAPAWSPDGTKLAFQSDRSGTAEIWVMNADGSNPVRLTATGGNFRPAWSPDGTRIAFTCTRDGNGEIYAVNADGTGPVNLTNDAADDADAAWSPDGTRIAFRRGDGIHLMNADGSGVTRLTNDPYVFDSQPAWSPDGGWLVISRWWCAEWCLQTIWVMSAANGSAWALTALNPDCETHSDPAWSPDGRHIAFTATDYCSGGVSTVNIVEGSLTSGVPLTEGFSPSWRPYSCDDGNP